MTATVRVGDVKIGGGGPLALIAGPCVIESLDLCIEVATFVRDTAARLGMPYIFKA